MKNIYLLYGEEKFDLNKKVESIKKEFSNLELGVNLYYLNKDNINELSNICQGVSFFGTEKLIIIKDTGLKFNIDILDDIDPDIKVVIIEDSVDKRISEYKKLSKMAECIEYKHMDQKQMADYLYQTLRKYGLNISYDDAIYMQNVCGEDKTNNINEMQKIVSYLERGDTISKDVIDKVCSKTLNAKIFDVLGLIVNKRKDEAIKSLNDLLEQKEPIVKIYIMLYKQVYQMFMIKYMKQKNEPNITQVLGIHPFVFKNLSKSCDKYSLEELKNIIYSFDEYDEKTKSGEMEFEIGLKKIICMMS